MGHKSVVTRAFDFTVKSLCAALVIQGYQEAKLQGERTLFYTELAEMERANWHCLKLNTAAF